MLYISIKIDLQEKNPIHQQTYLSDVGTLGEFIINTNDLVFLRKKRFKDYNNTLKSINTVLE